MKRIISMLLCMAMMFTSLGVFAEEAAVTEDAAVTEIAEVTEEAPAVEPIEIDWESIGLLETLGIIDEVNEDEAQEYLTTQISRAEFAVALVKFANMESTVGGANNFKDVIKGSYEEPYINAAVNAGLIATVAEGYYYPKYPISYQDAAQALVMSLGYTAVAEIDNSWLRQAKKLGLMKGVDTNAAFTREQAYTMLFNALHADVLRVSGLSGEVADYTTTEGYDALREFFDIKHNEGIITKAGGIELGTGVVGTDTEYIKQGGNTYYYGQHDYAEYLGRNAVVYYDDDEVAIYVRFEDNEELVLTSEDIINYSNLEYTYGDDKKSAKVVKPPYVILNGEEYLGAYTIDVMKPISGSVTLVDNNRNGVYDIVLIMSYEDYYVKGVMQTSYKVVPAYSADKDGDGAKDIVELDPLKHEIQVYSETNQLLDFSAIQTGNVISVAQSGSKIQVYISTANVTGAITKTSTQYGKTVYNINDTEYKLSQSLINELKNADTKLATLKIGENYKFYLNKYGEIAYYEVAKASTGDGKFYAVIVAGKKEGIDNKVELKVFAKEFGGFQSLTVPSKITLNGSNATPEFVYNSLNRDGVDGYRAEPGKIYPQPVKMKVNDNNEVTYIAQASVGEYYSAMDKWGTTTNNYVLPAITEPNSFPDYEPEFQLYMGDPTGGGSHRAYRDIIDQGAIPGIKATVEKHPYSVQAASSGGRSIYRALKPASNITVYQVPMYLNVTDTERMGKIAPEKEDFFAMASIPRAAGFKMMAYKEGEDSRACSFCLNIVSADAATTVGNNFSIRLVTEITEEYINEETITVVNTHAGKFYIKPGTIDMNALPFYSYTEKQWFNPVTGETTYKVNPGDLINISVDTLNYAKAVEPVFDATNGYFLGDYQQGNSNSLASGENKIYNNRNHPFTYGTREADNVHKIEWVLLEHFDSVNGAIEGKSYAVSSRYAKGTPMEGLPAAMNATKVFSMTPGSCTAVSIGRNGAITTRNATGSDFITEEDAPGEASILLLSQRYMTLNGSSFLYPSEMTKNWPKSPAEVSIAVPTP